MLLSCTVGNVGLGFKDLSQSPERNRLQHICTYLELKYNSFTERKSHNIRAEQVLNHRIVFQWLIHFLTSSFLVHFILWCVWFAFLHVFVTTVHIFVCCCSSQISFSHCFLLSCISLQMEWTCVSCGFWVCLFLAVCGSINLYSYPLLLVCRFQVNCPVKSVLEVNSGNPMRRFPSLTSCSARLMPLDSTCSQGLLWKKAWTMWKLDGENKWGAEPEKADIVLNAHIHTLTWAHRCTSDDFIDVLLYLLSDDPCMLLLHKDSLLLLL